MGDVHALFGNEPSATCHTAEEKAAYLEAFAARVRSGEIELNRGVLVYDDAPGNVRHEAFGPALTLFEFVGMMEYAKLNVVLP